VVKVWGGSEQDEQKEKKQSSEIMSVSKRQQQEKIKEDKEPYVIRSRSCGDKNQTHIHSYRGGRS
jgi:hypothetical protein